MLAKRVFEQGCALGCIEAGVHVACVRYNNTHHDFMMLNALAETAPTRAAVAQAAAALKKMLH